MLVLKPMAFDAHVSHLRLQDLESQEQLIGQLQKAASGVETGRQELQALGKTPSPEDMQIVLQRVTLLHGASIFSATCSPSAYKAHLRLRHLWKPSRSTAVRPPTCTLLKYMQPILFFVQHLYSVQPSLKSSVILLQT